MLVPFDPRSTIRLISAGLVLCPRKTTLETYYKRPSKHDEIVNRLFLLDEMPYYDPNAALLRYDELYAVDTNTLVHSSGRTLSITSICSCEFILGTGGFLCDARIQELGCALNYELEHPEGLAWLGIIRRLRREGRQGQAARQGIIVDSHLDAIGSYNELRAPVVGNLYLPDNIDLIFATGDSGCDQFTSNKMMAACDSYSRRAWKERLRAMSGDEIDQQVRAWPRLVDLRGTPSSWRPPGEDGAM